MKAFDLVRRLADIATADDELTFLFRRCDESGIGTFGLRRPRAARTPPAAGCGLMWNRTLGRPVRVVWAEEQTRRRRNAKLLEHSLVVLEECLRLSDEVRALYGDATL